MSSPVENRGLFEHKHEPLLPLRKFLVRLFRSVLIAGGVVFGSLGIGVLGYHFTENLPWIDALLNAAMILTGMGPACELRTTGGKLFAVFYALFSGVVFLTLAAVLFAPIVHRLLHSLHMELDDKDSPP